MSPKVAALEPLARLSEEASEQGGVVRRKISVRDEAGGQSASRAERVPGDLAVA
jgi:hypothetical protein